MVRSQEDAASKATGCEEVNYEGAGDCPFSWSFDALGFSLPGAPGCCAA